MTTDTTNAPAVGSQGLSDLLGPLWPEREHAGELLANDR